MTDDDNLSEIKIGCLGDSSVGKTLLAKKYVKDPTLKEFWVSTSELPFSIYNKIDYTISTIGVEFLKTKRILSDGNKYKVIIYDTAGQERYKSLSLNSIKHCDGVILIYDITNRESFKSISEWIKNIYDIKDNDFPLILIGNKCDLKVQREVSTEEGLEAAEQYKTKYFKQMLKKE